MKKLYTLILCLTLFSGVTKAQLTLTQAANEPVVGDLERRQKYDSTTTMVNSPGTNQTWNFTSLTANTVAAVTYSYVTPSAAPGYTASFAAATVAKVTSSVSSDFFKSSSNLYEFIASRPSSSLTLTFSNYATIAQWPITNTYSVSDAFSGTIKAVIFLTGTGPFTGVQDVVSTGTGTLQLPNSISLNNCMQVTSNFSLTGSVTVFTINATMTITSTSYNYYHASQKFPVLTVNYSTSVIKTGTATPTPQKTIDISINNDVFSGINEFTLDNSYSVYPNPASGIFNISLTNAKAENVTFEIFNQLGQSIKKENLGNGSLINSTINTSDFKSGVYFVRTTLGNKSSVKKLIIE